MQRARYRNCLIGSIFALSLGVASSPYAGAQSTNPDDYNGIRVCTPDEVEYLRTRNDPTADSDAESSTGAPDDEGAQGDWMKEGTFQHKVAQEIYDFWTKKIGTSGAFAAGVLANVQYESGFIPNISEGGGRFESPKATTPSHGGPGGGLYQFTPYEKYVKSPHFAAGGWTVNPQSQFVWDSEFVTGGVEAGMKNSPNLYGIEAPFTRAYTVLPKSRSGDPQVILDPNALVTTDDPAKASKGFQVGYERPGQYHPEREQAAIAANKMFNKDNYRGDARKLSEAVPKTAVAQGALNALDTLAQYASGAMNPDEANDKHKLLFDTPCLLEKEGRVILDLQDARAYASFLCSTEGRGGTTRSGGSERSSNSGDGGGKNAGAKIDNKDKLVPDARRLAEDVAREFPEIETIGGWRPSDPYPDHPSGRAVDVMIPDYSSPKGKRLGKEVDDFVHANKDRYNLEYTIWEQRYRPAEGQGNVMEDRGGDTANHFDHVHVTVKGSASGGGNNSDTSAAKRSRSGGAAASMNAECGGQSGGKAGGSIKPNPNGAAIPAEGTVTSFWGDTGGREVAHNGIDIANAIGTPIYAIADGQVIDSGPATGYGLWIRIKHEDGSISEYGHQIKNHVKVGDTVKAGDHIADMGSQGYSTGSHLHLSIYDTDGKTKINPQEWFDANDVNIKSESGFQVKK